MKSIALTLAVLIGTLSFAQATTETTSQPAAQDEILAVDSKDGKTEIDAVEIEEEKQ